MASLTNASAVLAKCSTSRARRRLRLIRDRVRLTIRRSGRTPKPLAPGCAAHDPQAPCAGFRDDVSFFGTLIALIGEDDLNEWKAPPFPPAQHKRRPFPILRIGRVDHDTQHQAKRGDKQMLLVAFGLLACVIARFLAPGPPFSVDLAVRLSMTAAVGKTSRPSASRTVT